MDLLNLTTTDAVRAALGIELASGELDDSVFADLRVEDLLELELDSWLPQPRADILVGGGRPLKLLQSAATYYTAALMLEAGELSFAERHEDGQNKMKRQTHAVQELIDRLLARYRRYRQDLLDALLPQAQGTGWMAGAARPNVDPVTQ